MGYFLELHWIWKLMILVIVGTLLNNILRIINNAVKTNFYKHRKDLDPDND